MFSNYTPDKLKLLGLKESIMYEDNAKKFTPDITEMNEFYSFLFLNTPILGEDNVDKRLKQLRNNIVCLIKICNFNSNDRVQKVKQWVESAKRCDVKAASISNNNLKRLSDEMNKDVDEDLVNMFLNKYKFEPYKCHFYDMITNILHETNDIENIFYIVYYLDNYTKTILNL